MSGGSSLQTDPDISDAHLLRGWYDQSGNQTSFRAQTGGGGGIGASAFRRDEVKSFNVVQETLLGLGDKPDYFSSRARIVHVKPDNISYTACPNCQKKVIEQDDGSWRCEKCAKSYPECDYRCVGDSMPQSLSKRYILMSHHRYLLSISCADHTGQIWLQGFNEVGELLLGITAKNLHELYVRYFLQMNWLHRLISLWFHRKMTEIHSPRSLMKRLASNGTCPAASNRRHTM